MPATRRTRAQTAKASTAVSLDTILLATAVGAGVAAYFFLDVAPEVVAMGRRRGGRRCGSRRDRRRRWRDRRRAAARRDEGHVDLVNLAGGGAAGG